MSTFAESIRSVIDAVRDLEAEANEALAGVGCPTWDVASQIGWARSYLEKALWWQGQADGLRRLEMAAEYEAEKS